MSLRLKARQRAIDVLVVKPDGMEWVQRKELTGEDQAIISSGL